MSTSRTAPGYVSLPILLGGVAIIFAALSAFLVLSNLEFKIQIVKESPEEKEDSFTVNQATSTQISTTTPVATSVSTTTLPAKLPKISEPPKVIPEKKVESKKTVSGWNAVYTDIADYETAFFSDFNLVSFDVLLGQSNIDLQKRLVLSSLETLRKLTDVVSGARKAYSSQLECLNKEQEAVDTFTKALNNSLVFFDVAAQLMKVDEQEVQLLAKLNTYSLRFADKDYGKAMVDIEAAKVLVGETKTTTLLAKQILPLPGFDGYVKWADMYTLGLSEVYTNIQTGNYERNPSTDFVTIGEIKTQASADVTKQITEWSVANLNTLLVDAGQRLSESTRLCKKDE